MTTCCLKPVPMKTKMCLSLERFHVTVSLTFTTIVGLLPTWVMCALWWYLPPTPLWQFGLATLGALIWLVCQMISWIVVCLAWDTHYDFDKKVCHYLQKITTPLAVTALIALCAMELHIVFW